MSYLDNYKSMAAGLVRGLRIFRTGQYGQRLIGTIGLYHDLIAEGCRQAFIARMPGHPEQAEDSAMQVGYDRSLVRFKYEPTANYKTRLQQAWDTYAQRGTNIGLKRELDYCLSSIWSPNGIFQGVSQAYCQCFENAGPNASTSGWAQHTTVLTAPGQGSVGGSWVATSELYGSATFTWGNTKYYGISNVDSSDMATIKKTIRDALPSRTRGFLVWNNSSTFYGSPITYGGGSTYSATSATKLITPVE